MRLANILLILVLLTLCSEVLSHKGPKHRKRAHHRGKFSQTEDDSGAIERSEEVKGKHHSKLSGKDTSTEEDEKQIKKDKLGKHGKDAEEHKKEKHYKDEDSSSEEDEKPRKKGDKNRSDEKDSRVRHSKKGKHKGNDGDSKEDRHKKKQVCNLLFEEYAECGPTCDVFCADLRQDCPKDAECNGGCQCRSGTARDRFGMCIPIELCNRMFAPGYAVVQVALRRGLYDNANEVLQKYIETRKARQSKKVLSRPPK